MTGGAAANDTCRANGPDRPVSASRAHSRQ